MSLIQQSITKALFSANLQIGGVAPFSENSQIAIPINFANVKNVKIFSGTYTPNNDYLWIWQSIPDLSSPTFLIAIFDKQVAIGLTFTKNNMGHSPKRFCFMEWENDASNLMTGCFLDGRLNTYLQSLPMAQGTPVNYTIIFGQASVS